MTSHFLKYTLTFESGKIHRCQYSIDGPVSIPLSLPIVSKQLIIITAGSIPGERTNLF
jgi:hypothetical protein